MKAVSLWSGGKDSCFAFYKARNSGYDIKYLLNFTSAENPEKSISHGLSAELIRAQAQAIGTPLIQRCASAKSYEEEFKKTVLDLKREGLNKIVFGDIYLKEHRDWIERVCEELRIWPVFPIWRTDTDRLIREFVAEGFESVVVSIKRDSLGKEWLGRKIDKDFINDIAMLGNIDPCGEKGEFHTLVINGPCFNKKIEVYETKIEKSDTHWFLKILNWRAA